MSKQHISRFRIFWLHSIAILLLFPSLLNAQQEEILLTLRHPAIGEVYVNSIYDYKADETFLPVIELFSLLEINYLSDVKNFTVSGNFITASNPYFINLTALQAQLGKTTYPLTPADFRIGEMDFFVSPKVYEKVFGLNFTVNITHLVLSLETKHNLPVQERKARERARNRMEDREILRDDFPLSYPRKRAIVSGTMIDYSLSGSYGGLDQGLGYTFTGGMEVLGGDVQGTIIGDNTSAGNNNLRANNLRWRYALRDNNLISGIMAGQVSTTGLQPLTIRGIAITNDPIEPRRMYETYVIDGSTEPESEVEIYINERIADYKRADELGYYRFDVPVTYGTTRISLRIYTPSGQIIITERQMQVPFTFLPSGVVSYNIQAGKTDNTWAGTAPGQWAAHSNMAIGVSRWLTASAGAQHLGNAFVPEDLFYYGSLSARLAKQYLLNLDAAPDNFYRLTGSVMYTSNLSLNFIYTKFEGPGIYNSRGANEEISANIYLPFTVFGLNTGLRFGGEHTVLTNSSQTRMRADFSTRLGPVNLRINYYDNLTVVSNTAHFGDGMLTTALTYTLSRSPGVPVYVRGMFVRGQALYSLRSNQLQSAELQLSKTMLKIGRLNLGAVYNFITHTINGQLGFTFDLRQVRSTTTANLVNNTISARQSFSGNFGWDMPNKNIQPSNRQQVGRSAASVLLFIDNNNSGSYNAGDQLLPYRGVKVDRSSTIEVGRDSVLRLTQLQSYYKYNLSVNRNALADPTLVPLKDEFSFIADPNQYKRIEIPFYRGGIIEGSVVIKRNGQQYGQGGLRLILKGVGKDYEQTIRNFTDGSFYTVDLPPGKYTLMVDPAQLGFLSVKQVEILHFEIKALSDGDYLEGLEIILVPDESDDTGENLQTPTPVQVPAPAETKVEIITPPVPVTPATNPEKAAPKPAGIEYRVQIARLTFNPANKGILAKKHNLALEEIKEDLHQGAYIYTIGSLTTAAEAVALQKRLKASHGVPDSFVVAFENGQRLAKLP